LPARLPLIAAERSMTASAEDPQDPQDAAIRRVVVLGAECTGKTQLCAALSTALPAQTFTEVLRAWVVREQRLPLRTDQADILAEQQRGELRALQAARQAGQAWVVCDSGPLMTAVYSLYYFQDDRLLAPALEHQRQYAMTLVCADDVPWVADPGQRDGLPVRTQVQALLLDVLQQFCPGSWALVGGNVDARLQQALRRLRALG